jgi:hypothetical protein
MIRIAYIIIFAICLLFNISIRAQNMNSLNCFNQINLNKIDANTHWNQKCNQGIESSSSVKICSKNIECLFNIYREFTELNDNDCYLLKDSVSNKYIYDIDFSKGVFILNNKYKKELKEIYNSYRKWIKLLKKHNIEYLRKNKISPITGTKYYWVKVN